MNSLVCNLANKVEIKEKLIDFMKQNNITYSLLECCGCERFCVDLSGDDNSCPQYCCNSGITVLTSNKDICKIYPYDILYIAIENRRSVLYLANARVETNYMFDYWKGVLDFKMFAQPHNSYIVNLNYVHEVNKDFVILKHNGKKYSVYTSQRKISAFKKAFLEYGTKHIQSTSTHINI